MCNRIFAITGGLAVLLLTACGPGKEQRESAARPMVYEGMPAAHLREVIGDPASIEPGGSVYDANTGKTKKVEKWHYDKRIVVIIDDTVKTPNLELPD